ncbi:MAG TPA: M56 family metallopeptidase [Clostridia bacterium]|nr:M56 family metallopeptidase [Clostridia bacterium]
MPVEAGVPAAIPQFEAGISAAGSAVPFSPWPILWLTPALLLLTYFVLAHFRWRRVYSKAYPLREMRVSTLPWSRTLCVKTSASIEAPLTYGVLRPIVLLPETLAKGHALDCALAHEIAHIRHWDALKKWMLTLALCAHWFNPLVWVMYWLANRDMELCCDASVLRELGEGEKARYASMLIDMEEARSALTPLVSHFSKNAIEERIIGIMKYKKNSWTGMLLALALVIFTTGALATSAVTPPADAYTAFAGSATSSTASSDPYANAKLYAPYAQFGLAYDMAADQLYYGGERVRYFEDFYPVGDGFYSGHCRTGEDGTVDVHTVRDLTNPKYNPDGSLDPSGELVGVAKYTQAEFDQRTAALEGLKAQLIPSPNLSTAAEAPVVQYSAAGGKPVIEWWTAETYEAWLDQQRVDLPKLIGGRAWNQKDGWFTWTQEKVDETLVRYEQILREIQAGALVSKSINGSDEAVISGIVSSPSTAASEAFTRAEDIQGVFIQFGDHKPSAADDTIAVELQEVTEPLRSSVVLDSGASLTISTAGSAAFTVLEDPEVLETENGHRATRVLAATFQTPDGQTVNLGSFETYLDRYNAVKAYCDYLVANNAISQAQADALCAQYR